MVLAVREKLFLGGVRKWQMPEVVKQRGQTNDLPPGHERFAVGKEIEVRVAVLLVRDDVEDAAGQLHDAQGMFETAMRGAGINEVGQRQLMDVPEPLKWPRIDRRNFVRRDTNEVVKGVPNLVMVLRHGCPASYQLTRRAD